MKRTLLFAALCLLILVPASRADYYNPPGWEQDQYFTHQSWDFNTDDGTDLEPDDDVFNLFGIPLFNITGLDDNVNWRDMISEREGVWIIQEGEAEIDIYIPNQENTRLHKEIWFQATVRSGAPTADVISMFTNINVEVPGSQFDLTASDYTVEAAGNSWFYITALLQIQPQPDWEILHFDFTVPTGKLIKIDQIDIDTRCVPEPTSMGLMLLGTGALVWRKRRYS